MTIERLYHSIRLLMLKGYPEKARYLKKHHIFDGIGENCLWGPIKMPLYPKLIRLHNNVLIHKSAVIITHDSVNKFLKKAKPNMDFGNNERIGCVEIMDNVYVGKDAMILPGVRIGGNCIISAGSVVTQDIPENSVVAGNPAKVIGRFDIYCAMRSARKQDIGKFRNQKLSDELARKQWESFEKQRAEKERNAP